MNPSSEISTTNNYLEISMAQITSTFIVLTNYPTGNVTVNCTCADSGVVSFNTLSFAECTTQLNKTLTVNYIKPTSPEGTTCSCQATSNGNFNGKQTYPFVVVGSM